MTREATAGSRRPPNTDLAGLVGLAETGAAGWTRSARRHAVRTRGWVQQRRSVLWVPDDAAEAADADEHELRRRTLVREAVASVRVCSRASISHASAAATYEVPVLAHARPCVTVPAGTALRGLKDVHLHRATLIPDHLTELGGYSITTPARTVCDLCREFGLASGVVAMDAALHDQLATRDDLDRVLRAETRWPGKRQARAAYELSDGRSESPLESLSRLQMIRSNLPAPELQPWIYDLDGNFVGRLDFYWPEWGIAGEADGLSKYRAGWDVVVRERRRQQLIERTKLDLVRWEWDDLRTFDAIARELRAAAERAAGRPRLWRAVLTPRI